MENNRGAPSFPAYRAPELPPLNAEDTPPIPTLQEPKFSKLLAKWLHEKVVIFENAHEVVIFVFAFWV